MHYAFLSVFAHATKSGYEVDRRPYPNSTPAPHVLGELALLYVATIAVSELRSWADYLERRAQLLTPLSSTITELASRAGDVVAYFWFLGGQPQPLDYCQEANRRAHPLLLAGQPCEIDPSQLQPDDVGYYPNPVDRLQRMHTGEREMTTGFGFSQLVLASLVEAMPGQTRLGLRSAHLGAGQGQKTACGHQLAAIANGPLAANRFPVAASTQSDVRRGRVATPCAPCRRLGGTLPGAGPIMEVVGPADLVLALNDALIQAISRLVDDWQNPIAIERARFRPFVRSGACTAGPVTTAFQARLWSEPIRSPQRSCVTVQRRP